jgi:hypothetical protein
MKKHITTPRYTRRGLLVVFINQIWPLIKWQKGEKLANLVTYAFTINQVPYVFGDYYFAGYKHKYMEDFIKRRFPNNDLRKRIRETPTKTFQTRWNTMEQWSMSSLEPTTQRRWRGGSVRGQPLPYRRFSATPSSGGGMDTCWGGASCVSMPKIARSTALALV